MKLTNLFLLSVILIALSCDSKNDKTISVSQEQIDAFNRLDSSLSFLDDNVQTFRMSSKQASTVNGASGSVIHLNPVDLETVNGAPIGDTIEVLLKELLTTNDLLNSRAQTVSNGQILESGGAYFISLKSNGNELKVKQGQALLVEFPKTTDKDMQLFYGDSNALGTLNWQPTEQSFKQAIPPPQQALISEVDSNVSYAWPVARYEAIGLTKLNWINCDRFIDQKNITQVDYNLTTSGDVKIKAAHLFVIFKDINSILGECYWHKDNVHSLGSLPLGATIKLIAVAESDGNFYSYQTDLIISNNQTINVELNPATKTELEKLFNL